jgi:hypothetical protein
MVHLSDETRREELLDFVPDGFALVVVESP